MAEADSSYYMPYQYGNQANARAHYETTGPELWHDTDGAITHFVAGVGTGGTISGAGKYLKEVSDGAVRVIGADPEPPLTRTMIGLPSGLERVRWNESAISPQPAITPSAP